jgi:adenylate cyclase
LANAYRLSGQIDEAIAAFEAYNARSPGFGLVDLVIAYQENAQADKAKDAAKRLLSARRDFTISAWLKTHLLLFRVARAHASAPFKLTAKSRRSF